MSNGFQQLHTTTTVRTVSQNDTGCNNFTKKILVLAASVIAKRDGVAPRPDTRTASAFPTRLGTGSFLRLRLSRQHAGTNPHAC